VLWPLFLAISLYFSVLISKWMSNKPLDGFSSGESALECVSVCASCSPFFLAAELRLSIGDYCYCTLVLMHCHLRPNLIDLLERLRTGNFVSKYEGEWPLPDLATPRFVYLR